MARAMCAWSRQMNALGAHDMCVESRLAADACLQAQSALRQGCQALPPLIVCILKA